MIITTTGFIQRLNFSEKFCNFTNYHHTFGKNTKIYNADSDTYLDFELVALHRKDTAGLTQTDGINNTTLTDLYAIVNWLFTATSEITANNVTVNNLLDTNFGNSNLLISVDEMLVDTAGNILPNVLNVEYTDGDDTYRYEFWFNSTSIDVEYPESDIIVIGPTANIDDLLNSKSVVSGLINQRDLDDYNTTINDANKDSPYTGVVGQEVKWVNKDNIAETLQIRFTFICYGPVLDDPTRLGIALRQYVEDNTSVSDSVWEVVLPEVFTATTFLMVPAWDKVANGVGSNVIYNPIITTNHLTDVYTENFSTYTEEWVKDNFVMLPVLWQSLAIAVVGAPKNKAGFQNIAESLLDYMLVGTTTADFISLTPSTRDFVVKLNNMLPVAQTYVTGDTLPNTLTLEVIDGFNFLVFSSYNLKCKVLTKEHYIALKGG